MRRIYFTGLIFFISSIVNGQGIKSVKITDLEKIISGSKTPFIVNFWATWCKPCLEEIPYFMEEVKKHSNDSLQLLLVSVDMEEAYPAKIKKSITKNGISVPVYWLNETNADYFCPKVDPKWSGAIPASLFINNKTGYRKFFEEQLYQEKLQLEIKALLENQ